MSRLFGSNKWNLRGGLRLKDKRKKVKAVKESLFHLMV